MLEDKVKPDGVAEPASAVSRALNGVILVHVPTEGDAESCRLAVELAKASGATVTAVTAEGFEPAAFNGAEFTSGSIMQALLDAQRRRITAARQRVEALRKATGAPIDIFVSEQFPEDALTAQACGADWIVQVRPERNGAHSVYGDPSAVVLRTGSPLLLAPRGAAPLNARRIVLAWRDSREARRAVAAAMPLLIAADEVLVLGVSSEDQAFLHRAPLEQVVSRLKRHGCNARCELHLIDGGEGVVSILEKRAADIGADLIVSGAYAHSRAGEWVFGGVTRSLIEACSFYLLMIH